MTRTIATASRSTSLSPKPDRREFMRPTTFHWACVALALASPAAAQQSAPGGASVPSGATHEVNVESAIPLTPNMIRDLGRRVGDNKPRRRSIPRSPRRSAGGSMSRSPQANRRRSSGSSRVIRPRSPFSTALGSRGRSNGTPTPIRPARPITAIAIRGLREERARRSRAPGSMSARRRSDRTSCKSLRPRCSRAAGFS
jgi:hypothetical protein